MYQKKNDKYIIDLFSGCGGFAEGFKKSLEEAGAEVELK